MNEKILKDPRQYMLYKTLVKLVRDVEEGVIELKDIRLESMNCLQTMTTKKYLLIEQVAEEWYMNIDKAIPGTDIQEIWRDQLQKYRDDPKCWECGMYLAGQSYCEQCDNHKK